MRKVAVVLVAAATLGACGGGDGGKAPEKADKTPPIKRNVAQLRAACVRTQSGEPTVANYETFVRELKALGASEQVAVQEGMLKKVQSAGTPDAVYDAYAADDEIDARQGLIDCIWPGSTAESTPKSPDQICADNRARTARARSLAPDAGNAIDEGSSERLTRLVAVAPRPADDARVYGGWTDSLQTAANLYRLAGATSDDTRAKALREQAGRTAAAARETAAMLGLAECAKP